MLLLAASDRLLAAIDRGLARAPQATVRVARGSFRGLAAVCAVGDGDPLDDAIDPAVDAHALARAIAAEGVASGEADTIARVIADRENVVASPAARARGAYARGVRPPTLFELAALEDVLGAGLAGLLPPDRVEIDEAPLAAGGLNHCSIDADGVARVRFVETNGVTLAARAHASVHELCHALVGLARLAGWSYAAPYGQPDYGRFLDATTFERVCDEEALVRAAADAWLLRRREVTWARTWPGAIDDAGRELDADDLAAFARFRLAQGLALPCGAPPCVRSRRR